jgi:hypothetical protein
MNSHSKVCYSGPFEFKREESRGDCGDWTVQAMYADKKDTSSQSKVRVGGPADVFKCHFRRGGGGRGLTNRG